MASSYSADDRLDDALHEIANLYIENRAEEARTKGEALLNDTALSHHHRLQALVLVAMMTEPVHLGLRYLKRAEQLWRELRQQHPEGRDDVTDNLLLQSREGLDEATEMLTRELEGNGEAMEVKNEAKVKEEAEDTEEQSDNREGDTDDMAKTRDMMDSMFIGGGKGKEPMRPRERSKVTDDGAFSESDSEFEHQLHLASLELRCHLLADDDEDDAP
ncbi:hypothetical protein FB567DRAFT_43275 [Paraphoma chrysanthemicola]|uniref:Uncharacterized protein n=1 Tax=Paraphoma chrysanthemicola TaxID=798071 RepID=A0A8K0RJ15_9PLEO|nr:hypothetical protein FB567DRAFT_43275 [Paraphoma chrysanthemicola]